MLTWIGDLRHDLRKIPFVLLVGVDVEAHGIGIKSDRTAKRQSAGALVLFGHGKSLGLPTCITPFNTLWDRQAPFAVGQGVPWSVYRL